MPRCDKPSRNTTARRKRKTRQGKTPRSIPFSARHRSTSKSETQRPQERPAKSGHNSNPIDWRTQIGFRRKGVLGQANGKTDQAWCRADGFIARVQYSWTNFISVCKSSKLVGLTM